MKNEQPRLTPMFEQYFAIKAEYPDALLFYRMGDFYELFYDDAEIAARELQIALTSRNPNAENPVPMCGVPHHAAESYLNQLLEKGHKVAICDQIEDPKTAKGLVKRAVTIVRTPGTAVEDIGLSPKGHNYLGALFFDAEKGAGGFAWLEYSTGSWSGLYSKKEAELWQWVQKMQPRELLVPDLPAEVFRLPQSLDLSTSIPVRLPVRSAFDRAAAERRILQAQNIRELGAIGLNGKDELVRACGAILSYLERTQKQDLTHLAPFVPLNLSRHLIVDEISERNLEIFRRLDGKKGSGTLLHILDETLTPMGGRLLEERLRHPWREVRTIAESANAVEFFHAHEAKRRALREVLDTVYDLERLSTRITLGRAAPKDFSALGRSLAGLAKVHGALTAVPAGTYAGAEEAEGRTLPPQLFRMYEEWDSLEDLADLLDRALLDALPNTITEGGLFRPGYNAELDELLDLVEHGEGRLQALLAEEQEKTGIPRLKLGYNKVFGYYFEVSKTQVQRLPEHFIRRQTVASGERCVTPALRELEDKMLAASDRRKQLEYRLFQELRGIVAQARSRILFMAGLIAALDFWQGLAECAKKHGWRRPELHDGAEIRIREGRHPVVEAMCGASGFIPNDLRMDDERRMLLITGPNMAGKSTVLRQTAIICLLAQMGAFVPAAEASIGLVDRIFSRVGASDNLAQGQSTFMVEMMETARILRQAGKKSLVILDEIGRGTSTFDGLALAWSVVESLTRREGGIRTLFATHYHELTALEGRLPGVHNMNIAIREWNGEIVFLRRLVPGPSDRSYGIEVAKLAGVPQDVVRRAGEILKMLEQARAGRDRTEAATALQQLLPGLAEPVRKQPALMPEPRKETEHPLAVTLRDLDTDHLTPIKALQLITEWKLLWGGESS